MTFNKAEVKQAFPVSEDFFKAADIAEWCDGKLVEEIDPETGEKTPGINVQTLRGVKRASIGDWICLTYFDEFLVVNEKTYHQE